MNVVRRHARDLAVVESPGRLALLDLTRLEAPPVVLEGSAVAIWAAIDGERDGAEICRHLARTYGMAPEQVRADVADCLTTLASLGLLTTRSRGK